MEAFLYFFVVVACCAVFTLLHRVVSLRLFFVACVVLACAFCSFLSSQLLLVVAVCSMVLLCDEKREK